MIAHSLRNGSIFVCPNFLPSDIFEEFFEKVKEYPYIEGYQPAGTFYGNRFQAYPVHETKDLSVIDSRFFNWFKNGVQDILEDKIIRFHCCVRKTITEELKRSKVNTKYGIVHSDYESDLKIDPSMSGGDTAEFAGVFQFVQSFDGGTAFFENAGDKVPDIEVSAYPNRLTMYSGGRLHANCTDFTFDERIVVLVFIKTEKLYLLESGQISEREYAGIYNSHLCVDLDYVQS